MKFDLGMSVQQFGFMESLSSVGGILGMLLISIFTIKNRYKTVMWALFGMVIGVCLIWGTIDTLSRGADWYRCDIYDIRRAVGGHDSW